MVNQVCGNGFTLLENFSLVEVELGTTVLKSNKSKSELGSVLKNQMSKAVVKNVALIHP